MQRAQKPPDARLEALGRFPIPAGYIWVFRLKITLSQAKRKWSEESLTVLS